MSYCENCGTPIQEGQSFCSGCGARIGGDSPSAGPHPNTPVQSVFPTNAAPQQSSEATLQKLVTLKAQAPSPAKGSGNKILIAVLAVFLVGAIAAVAGVVYVGYREKQKANTALDNLEGKSGAHKVTGEAGSGDSSKSNPGNTGDGSTGGDTDDPLSAVLGKLQGDGGSSSSMGNMGKSILEDLGAKNPDMPPDLVRNMPWATLTNPLPCPTGVQIDPGKLANGRILFKPGTVLTYAWSLPLADAEEDSIIRAVSPATLLFTSYGTAAAGLDMAAKSRVDFLNTVCAKDIAQGEAYSTGWEFNSLKDPVTPGLYPGVSRLLVPATKFSELKSSGSTELVFAFYDYMDALTEWELLAWKGTFMRVEPNDVPFPLIINDERVNVPALHVRANMKVIETAGRFGPRDQPLDAYILDDANTPVMLSWMMGVDMHQDDSFKVVLVRVTYPSDKKPTIEQQLEKNRKAITWGINFDFNSDTIRPVSEPVLKEIAQAMADRPSWKLTITGHTDNIGGHKYNQELSQRRSAAVKKALVDRYRVDPNRLSTGGAGDYAPIDTNDTLEGRARNRRVELTLD
jgi:outer membrane protein OmpA-like peptidoglycan-associated protein